MPEIMLAKSYNEKRVEFPCYVSEKLDGAASYFEWGGGKVPDAMSRQDKEFYSVEHIQLELADKLARDARVVGELHIPGMAFKDAGGIIRRKQGDTRIKLGVYDFVDDLALPFSKRIKRAQHVFAGMESVFVIPVIECHSHDDIEAAMDYIMENSVFSNPEGIMIRSGRHMFEAGKRSWGMMRLVPKPTMDLKVIGFEEAVYGNTQANIDAGIVGHGKGMVGGILVEYKGEEEGCGPGKLKHTERIAIWENQADYIGKIAQVEYKKDPSYTGLRQPTFQLWREDKDEPNED